MFVVRASWLGGRAYDAVLQRGCGAPPLGFGRGSGRRADHGHGREDLEKDGARATDLDIHAGRRAGTLRNTA